jgi:hypothetical protein
VEEVSDLRVVYNETIKGELNARLIYECRCDERVKTKDERSTRLSCTLLLHYTPFSICAFLKKK